MLNLRRYVAGGALAELAGQLCGLGLGVVLAHHVQLPVQYL